MQFYVIVPEVAGGWGKHMVVDRSVDPMRIEHLHYQFDGWLGDELLTTHPAYICTQRVADALSAARFSGFRLGDVEVTISSRFRELYPRRKLPPFRWLQIKGEPERDDFGLRSWRLVISERALACLRSFSLTQARVYTVAEFEWDPEKYAEKLIAEGVQTMGAQSQKRKRSKTHDHDVQKQLIRMLVNRDGSKP